jgi:hypothetical protein
MTHRPIRRVEPDGTRVYADYHRYKPVPVEKRKTKIRKPDNPDAILWNGNWYLPLDVLPEDQRVMPETRPDSLTLEHGARCRCEVCLRPEAAILWRRRHASANGRVIPVSRRRPREARRRA